jgi:endonuclease YncB( thermonuclease family)
MILSATIMLLLASAPEPDLRPGIPATFIRIKDGDTFVMTAHLPFGVHITMPIRLKGIDCPETKGLAALAGRRARKFTKTWAIEHPNVVIQDTGKMTFERRISTVCPAGRGRCLSEALRDAGHFKVYENLGKKRKKR